MAIIQPEGDKEWRHVCNSCGYIGGQLARNFDAADLEEDCNLINTNNEGRSGLCGSAGSSGHAALALQSSGL